MPSTTSLMYLEHLKILVKYARKLWLLLFKVCLKPPRNVGNSDLYLVAVPTESESFYPALVNESGN